MFFSPLALDLIVSFVLRRLSPRCHPAGNGLEQRAGIFSSGEHLEGPPWPSRRGASWRSLEHCEGPGLGRGCPAPGSSVNELGHPRAQAGTVVRAGADRIGKRLTSRAPPRALRVRIHCTGREEACLGPMPHA